MQNIYDEHSIGKSFIATAYLVFALFLAPHATLKSPTETESINTIMTHNFFVIRLKILYDIIECTILVCNGKHHIHVEFSPVEST